MAKRNRQYTLPTLPLTVLIYTGTSTRPPLRITTRGNLVWGRRAQSGGITGPGAPGPPRNAMWLFLPAGTDIRSAVSPGGTDTVVVDGNKADAYYVLGVDDANKGLATEFRVALVMAHTQLAPLP